MKNYLFRFLFVVGAMLLLVSIYGLFRTMRNPAIYEENRTGRVSNVTITYPDIKKLLVKRTDETNKEFAVRVNTVVNQGFMHYWRDPAISEYYLRVPIWENYLLHFASWVNPKRYRKYEFSDYRKNLERGLGLCSTHSTVVKGVLNDHGIQADLWDIAGHVVVTADVAEDESIILDPDYGIAVPHDMATIEKNPEVTRPYYANMHELYKPEYDDPYTTDIIVDLYGSEGNKIYTVDHWFEHFAYRTKWIWPILFMLPAILRGPWRKSGMNL